VPTLFDAPLKLLILVSWKIAIPIEIAIILILLKDIIHESFTSLLQRRYVLRLKKNHRISVKRRKLKRT